MKGVLALLAVLAPLGAGPFPPTVEAVAPVWIGAHTIEFGYGEYPRSPNPYAVQPYVVGDDGSGLAPATAPAPAPDPTVSPDGKHRYTTDPVTHVLSIDGVPTPRTADGAVWAPDSTRLAVASEGRISVMNSDGSRFRAVHAGTSVAWVSNDELVVGSYGDDADIYTVRADGTHARRVVTGASSFGGLAVSPDGTQLAFTASFSSPWAHGSTLYVASLGGLDQDIRRLSPDPCTCGTDGPDHLVGSKAGDLLIGGAGDDIIHAGDGQNYVYGQWGNDTILTGSYYDTVWGGGGNDVIRTGGGEDTIYPGSGRDIVDAGRGPDHVIANDGERDVIDCGPGDDRARVDRFDVVRNCEHVTVVS